MITPTNHYAISQSINSIVLLLLGVFVFFNNKSSSVNRIFALHGFTGAIWSFSFFQMVISKDADSGLFWSKALHYGAVLVPVFFLHLNIEIIGIAHKRKYILAGVYAIALTMLFFINTPYGVTHTVESSGIKYFVGPGSKYYHLFPMFFCVCVCYGFIELFRGYLKSAGLKKTQLKYLLVASLFGYSGGPGGFLPLYSITIPSFAFYTVSIYLGIIAFAVVRYRLFDVEIILKRISFYLISISSVLLISYLLAQGYYYLTGLMTSVWVITIISFGSVGVMSLMVKHRHMFESVAGKIVNRDRLSDLSALDKLSQQIKIATKENKLYDILCDKLIAHLHLEHVSIYSGNVDNTEIPCAARINPSQKELPTSISRDSPAMLHLSQTASLLESEKYRHENHHLFAKDSGRKSLQDTLDNVFQASLMIPLTINHKLAGAIVLGHPAKRLGFTDNELMVLENLGTQVSVMLENIRLYDHIIRDNRMELVGAMASSFAHEVRNPLTSIKTFIDMLPSKLDSQEFIQRFMDLVPGEIERIKDISDDFLNFARSAKPQYSEFEINGLVHRVMMLLNDRIKKQELNIINNINGPIVAKGDPNQIYQVMLNITLNAVQASKPEGKIIFDIVRNKTTTRIKIADEGEGIKPENLGKIFEPFFSTKIYGTGLGLSTCKRIMEEHGGDIEIESTLGKGSVFSIVIPNEYIDR